MASGRGCGVGLKTLSRDFLGAPTVKLTVNINLPMQRTRVLSMVREGKE